MSPSRTGLRAVLALVLVAGWGTPLAAQAGSRGEEEGRLLRTVALLESRGELEEAAGLLEEHLAGAPDATGVLFALERIRRSQGRLEEVLAPVDAYLEVEPAAGGIRYLELRILVELDSLRALEAAAEEWIAAVPADPEPYREVARIYARSLGSDRALEILRRGREAVAEPGALALQTGDLLMELGRPEDGGRAWARAVDAEGGGSAAVLRRVERLRGDRTPAVEALLDELTDGAPAPGRLRAGALVALETGLEERALELARDAVDAMDDAAARGLLMELASRSVAGREGGDRVAVWAYGVLRERTGDPEDALALDRRIADAALAAGDTAAAVAARQRVADALPRGSAERRAALAAEIRLRGVAVLGEDPDELARLLTTFREEYPEAPETDELAATLSRSLLAAGDREGALGALEGAEGPRSSLERAYLHLETGEVEEGREALLRAIPGLPPSRATALVELVGVLGRVSPGASELAGRAAALAHRGRPGEGAELVGGLDGVALQDRPPLLALGARLSEKAGDDERAASLRGRIVTDHPDAPEWPEAALALARHLAATPGRRAEAVELLEGLILERPDSAVVPAARRELERLRSRGGEGS